MNWKNNKPYKILGLETSAKAASVAVCEINNNSKKILVSGNINTAVTHSETLIPLMENLLHASRLNLSEIDCFAVTNGPGSFTGLRISVSAVKGMAWALNKPVYGVSSLLALAYNLIGLNTSTEIPYIACPVMDARCGQVYNALFKINGNSIERLTEDRAISVNDLLTELGAKPDFFKKERIIILGDGKYLFNEYEKNIPFLIAPPLLIYQNAVSVCFAAADVECTENETSAKTLIPRYLRLPQAERERLEKFKI